MKKKLLGLITLCVLATATAGTYFLANHSFDANPVNGEVEERSVTINLYKCTSQTTNIVQTSLGNNLSFYVIYDSNNDTSEIISYSPFNSIISFTLDIGGMYAIDATMGSTHYLCSNSIPKVADIKAGYSVSGTGSKSITTYCAGYKYFGFYSTDSIIKSVTVTYSC